jgi:uroporphyrin-III C-methyltransferase
MIPIGSVSIVGAGTGYPELITVRGVAGIRSAEVLVYDRLVDPGLLAEAPPAAELIFAGKARGYAALDQGQIEAVLIDRASAGKRVVRLKGGDPYVFGRGGEEVAALVAAGIPVEIVPGISSAISVPASAGIPVTHRELSSSLTIVTGHEDPTKPESTLDWGWLASTKGTLVILMGLHQLPSISERLIAGGKSPETPVAVIADGTRPDQRTITAPLGDIAAAASAAQLVAPALIVVGDVVRFRDLLAPSAVNGVPVVAIEAADSRVEPGPALFALRNPPSSLPSERGAGDGDLGQGGVARTARSEGRPQWLRH